MDAGILLVNLSLHINTLWLNNRLLLSVGLSSNGKQTWREEGSQRPFCTVSSLCTLTSGQEAEVLDLPQEWLSFGWLEQTYFATDEGRGCSLVVIQWLTADNETRSVVRGGVGSLVDCQAFPGEMDGVALAEVAAETSETQLHTVDALFEGLSQRDSRNHYDDAQRPHQDTTKRIGKTFGSWHFEDSRPSTCCWRLPHPTRQGPLLSLVREYKANHVSVRYTPCKGIGNLNGTIWGQISNSYDPLSKPRLWW